MVWSTSRGAREQILDTASVVARYRDEFESIWTAALPQKESLDLVEEVFRSISSMSAGGPGDVQRVAIFVCNAVTLAVQRGPGASVGRAG